MCHLLFHGKSHHCYRYPEISFRRVLEEYSGRIEVDNRFVQGLSTLFLGDPDAEP